MPPYQTNGIYYVDRPTLDSAKLGRRPGHVKLDETPVFATDTDDGGPLHVVQGLKVADIAVFLLVTHEEEGRHAVRSRIGYLVTDVNMEDGSGTLVGKGLFEKAPGEWTSDHVERLGQDLIRNGFNFAEEFGLGALQTYLTRDLPTD